MILVILWIRMILVRLRMLNKVRGNRMMMMVRVSVMLMVMIWCLWWVWVRVVGMR